MKELKPKMPPMTLHTGANNKKMRSETLPTRKWDYSKLKVARIDDRSFIYVPADASQEQVNELVEAARNRFNNLKTYR